MSVVLMKEPWDDAPSLLDDGRLLSLLSSTGCIDGDDGMA
jgi:hypothetical protein